MSPTALKLVKLSVWVMSLLLIIGIAVLIWGLWRQANKLETLQEPSIIPTSISQHEKPWQNRLAWGKGYHIANTYIADGIMAIHVKHDVNETQRILLYAIKTGKPIGSFDLRE